MERKWTESNVGGKEKGLRRKKKKEVRIGRGKR